MVFAIHGSYIIQLTFSYLTEEVIRAINKVVTVCRFGLLHFSFDMLVTKVGTITA